MNYFLILFIFSCVSLKWVKLEEDVEDFDDDIPIIEGDGGVITTAVENDVLILTRENFDLQISSKDIILVEFYAPWCGHCQSLAPEFSKAAKILKDEDPPISLAKVDATIETELAARYGVTGYPTLLVFKKGEKIPYEGPRSAMGIVDYMKERSDPDWKPPPEAVITLTSENFTNVIEKADIILVEFYAPWCGHCKQLAPEYERAAKALQRLATPILLAKVDGTVEKDLANNYEARGWPTLMIFRKGQKYAYEGPRDETGIISYMKEQAKPASQEVRSLKEIENSLGKMDSTVVGFFSSEDDILYQSFMESGNFFRGKFVFLHSYKENIAKHYKVQVPSIVLLQPELFATDFEPSKYVLEKADATTSEITSFVQDNFLPLVSERSHRNRWKYESKYPLVVVYYDVDFSFDHRVQTQLIRKEVAKVAKDYRGRITFAVSNEEEHADELIQLNLGDSGEDVNVAFFQDSSTRFRMEPTEDFSSEELRSFVEDVLAGKVPKHIKSQPVPRENKGPVLNVVGRTFNQLVILNQKDVFIEFYAPWCGHCKKLEPIFKKLGKVFANHEQVVIAKLDATTNDYPSQFVIGGFPTLYYVPAADKSKLISYDGDRTFEDLKKFVEKQLSSSGAKDEL